MRDRTAMRLKDTLSIVRARWRRRKQRQGLRTVLDVGSGHRPHDDATHLLDLLPEDDRERGKPIKLLGRPLVRGTIEAMPFKDASFDYVYACHVLEHTRDPALACAELQRVGKAGYIETPSPFYEQGYNYPRADRGWSFHRWFVWVRDGRTLVFEPKTEHTIDAFCACRHASFVKGIYERVTDLNALHKVLPSECNNTVLHWANTFEVSVVDGATEKTEP